MKLNFYKSFCILVILIVSVANVSAQSYGLAFASHDVVQDQRTALDLSPEGSLCFSKSFEISFDLAFFPNQTQYFGYIFRVIQNDQTNIDLIYNNKKGKKHFTLVTGDQSKDVVLDVDKVVKYKKWPRVILAFNYQQQSITFKFATDTYTKKIKIAPNSCFKILFGANNFGNFKTTDVPPMKIKDIRISEEGLLKYKWSLAEEQGSVATEEISSRNAKVDNPVWIKKLHYSWVLNKKFVTAGPASVAFDPKTEQVKIVGLDSLFSFSVSSHVLKSIRYASGRLNLLRGNQSYFDPSNRKLYNFYLDQKTIATFDSTSNKWDRNFIAPAEITDNWQFNKFYSPSDSSFYAIGGYGHYVYKNDVSRYHLPSGKWEVFKPQKADFMPRYLAALGQTEGGAYILGGYGSQTGEQVLNPKNIYDFLFFDVKTHQFKKIYELKISGEDFVFANSLVVDKKNKSYYGLVLPKHKFNSTLQLIKGSIDSPKFVRLGDTIPFQFHDINLFVDLYYSAASEQFIAVTLFLNDNNQTEVSIYSLASPPVPAVAKESLAKSNDPMKVIFVLVGVLALIVAVRGFRKRRKFIGSTKTSGEEVLRDDPTAGEVRKIWAGDENIPAEIEVRKEIAVSTVEEEVSPEEESPIPVNSQVFLFGDMQLFDSDGNDITKYFTPLIKELFLVILLYTFRWERGISSEKLKELLWFDKTAESARNNRSVNIAKLKAILDRMGSCKVSKETGYWKINVDHSQIKVDYLDYLNIVKDKRKLNKQKIKELAKIIQRGSFLWNLEYEWLDAFKSEISNEVVDTYLHFANSIEISEDPEFLIRIASYIFYFDAVNEEAMTLKCKALVYLGKHSLAKTTYENFKKEYKAIYGDDFNMDFQAILE